MNRTLTRAGAAVLAGGLVLGVGGAGAMASSAHSVAHSKPTYTIGYEGPLSGGNEQLGLNMIYAVQLAINNANAGKSFGKLPFKLALQKADDQGASGPPAESAASSLVTNPNVVAVVGPAFSGSTETAEPLYSKYNIATVSPSATRVSLAQMGWKNFFRVVAADSTQGPADADYAIKAAKAKTIISIDDNSAYGAPLVGYFDQGAKAAGVTPSHQTIPGTAQCSDGTASTTEYPAAAAKIASQLKGKKSPFIFYGGYYCDFALLTEALRHAGYNGKMMSGDGSETSAYVTEAGKKNAQGVYLSCPCSSTLTGARARAFAQGFQKLAKFAPAIYSAESFDATNVIIDVMKKLGPHVSRKNIVTELHKVTYKGLTKTVHFQANGDIAGNAIYMYQVQNGAVVQLGLVSKLAH